MCHYVLHQSNTEAVWWLYPVRLAPLVSLGASGASLAGVGTKQSGVCWVLILVNLSEPSKQSKPFITILNGSK